MLLPAKVITSLLPPGPAARVMRTGASSIFIQESRRIAKLVKRLLAFMGMKHLKSGGTLDDFERDGQAVQLVAKEAGRAEKQNIGVRQLLPLQLTAAHNRHGGLAGSQTLPQYKCRAHVTHGGVVVDSTAGHAPQDLFNGLPVGRLQQLVRIFSTDRSRYSALFSNCRKSGLPTAMSSGRSE